MAVESMRGASLLAVLKRALAETQAATATITVKSGPQEHRKQERHKFRQLRAEMNRPGIPTFTCVLEDLSEGGCRCLVEPAEELDLDALRADFARSQTVEIAFAETAQDRLRLYAQVRHLESGPRGALVIGLRFCPLSAPQQLELAAILEALFGASPAAEPAPGTLPPVTPELREACLHRELGAVLVLTGVLGGRDAAVAAEQAKERKQTFEQYLLENKLATEVELCQARALQSGLPTTSLSDTVVPDALWNLFPPLKLLSLELVPFECTPDAVCVATVHPPKAEAVAKLEQTCAKRVLVYLAPADRVKALLQQHLGHQHKVRKFARYKVSQPVQFMFCASDGTSLEGQAVLGKALDISEGGFCVEAPAPTPGSPEGPLQRNAMTLVVFHEEPKVFSALCRVRFAKPTGKVADGGRPQWVFGLQLVELRHKQEGILRETCIHAAMKSRRG